MDSWSKRRKMIYGSVFLAIAIVVIGVPSFFIFYRSPTCSDGLQNGSEDGVDCGGKCSRLCQSSFLPPKVAWTRIENVAPGVYNAAAYLINPNPAAEASEVPYHMALYDDNGIVIADEKGVLTLPPHRNTLAFKGSIRTGSLVPVKALFEFTSAPEWGSQSDPLSSLEIRGKDYGEDGNGSSLTVTLGNDSAEALSDITVYVVLYDASGNALGFSKTVVDKVAGRSTAVAPFTWPKNRQGAVVSIEVLPVAE